MDKATTQRIERLVEYISGFDDIQGFVAEAIRAVPRHQFIPDVALATPGDPDQAFIIDRETDPDTWWDTVYSRTPIVTQLDDGDTDIRTRVGAYTSSSSAPSTVAYFLQLLDPEPDDQVLEVGTGTGWTAALLAHLAGPHGSVTSIEIDKIVAEQAAKNLAAAGVRPHVIVGDGADGCPQRAPYDRVHITCGIRTVPYTWIEQCRPGGVVVAPYCPGFGDDHALRLVTLPDGTAIGRFPGYASYMMMRSQRPAPYAPDDGGGRRHPTRVHPRTIGLAPPGADLAMAAITGLYAHISREETRFLTYVLNPADPSQWAVGIHQRGNPDHTVYQMGDRPLWEEVTEAYFRWVGWGEPGRDRFGMTVTPEGQHVWLDTPDHLIGG
ncbi:methyltransferase domain-containing protein [Nonomuraea basaltis]|uniref:methyltransferase domain-containing protein n=1 Tax=Nonomuraea basaltis TaxID=2495887 RepID=UPI00110C40DA|nr:methyltransferase domain-containing protein [Nonomuraea basaltis]TMR94459.1 methyltransferase domain-containing protein [Nonomuraea basaltis]